MQSTLRAGLLVLAAAASVTGFIVAALGNPLLLLPIATVPPLCLLGYYLIRRGQDAEAWFSSWSVTRLLGFEKSGTERLIFNRRRLWIVTPLVAVLPILAIVASEEDRILFAFIFIASITATHLLAVIYAITTFLKLHPGNEEM